MSENTAAKNSFPLFGIAVLITIGLAVAKLAGWIHVTWFVVWLPVIIAVGLSLAIMVIVLVVLGIGFGIYLLSDRSKKSSGYVTPSRTRRLK